jgi:site-specific recombinase XerC
LSSDVTDAAHAQRQARPITAPDLRSLLTAIGTARPSDARDAALIALDWAGALRRSELVGLDWQQAGQGSGFVSIDERGITITLLRSKTSQAEAVSIVVPAQDMPAACTALAEWAHIAALKPGEPIFRRVDHWEHVGGDRLTGRTIARIIKTGVASLPAYEGSTPIRRPSLPRSVPAIACALCTPRPPPKPTFRRTGSGSALRAKSALALF